MLKSVMKDMDVNAVPSDDDLISFCDKLKGYVARDMVALVKRASHAHTILTGGRFYGFFVTNHSRHYC